MHAGDAQSFTADEGGVHAELLALSEEYHCALDGEDRLAYANPAFARLLPAAGQPRARPSFLDCMAADHREAAARHLGEARAGAAPVSWEATCGTPPDVRRVAWRARLQPHSGRVLALGRDVTAQRRTEAALREGERRFRDLIEGSIQGIVILRGRTPLFANESYARMFGYDSPEEIVALGTVDPLVTPGESERQAAYGEARLRGEEAPRDYEFEGVRKDGSRIWLACLARVVHWQGEPAVQATLFDITERKRAEQRLRDHERLLRTVIDTVPHLIFVRDREGTHLMVNSAWHHMHGLDPAAMEGRHMSELHSRPAANREHALSLDRQVLEADAPLEFEYDRSVEGGGVRRFHSYRAPLRDEAGTAVGVVGISEDITERKQAEEALRASQRLLRLLVDALPHNVYVKDREYRYVFVNQTVAAFHALAPERMLGRRAHELPGVTPREAERLEETDREVLAAGRLLEWPEVRITGADGRTTRRRLYKVPLRDDEGRVQAVVGISEDITAHMQAEEELRASRQLLQTVFDTLPHICVVKDAAGRYVTVNRRWQETYGMTLDEVRGLTTLEVRTRPREDLERTRALEDEALAARHTLQHEYDCTLHDGSVRRFHTYRTPLLDEHGAVTGLVGVGMDVTEARRAEEALRASHRLLRTAFDTMPGMVAVRDAEGRYQIVNESWLAEHGVTREAALGRRPEEIAGIPAADAAAIIRQDRPILREGRAYAEDEYVRERPGGVRQHFLTFRTPLLDDAGGLAGVVGVAIDITALKRAEEEARAGRALLQTVFDTLPLWIYVKDREGRLTMVNRRMAEDHGTTAGEAVRHAPRVLSPELTEAQRAVFVEADRRVLQGEQVELARTDATLPDGETRRFRSIRVPLRDAEGAITGILCIAEDITERERVEQAVQQAQKLESLGVLAGGIAHDFNNLLVSVLGYAHLAAVELPPDSPVQPLVQQIETAGRRASELCNQMLAYAGKGSFQVSQVQLNDLIREMGDLIRVSLSRNVRLNLDFAPELPPVEADATQLRQVVMNLVINASEAIGEADGEIHVRTGVRQVDAALLGQFVADADLPAGRYVSLEVADTGCGMDAGTVTRMFEPFFSTKFTGRGLGLAAVMGIVRGHRGALRVTSTPGAGTTFHLLLPQATAAAEAAGAGAGPAPWQATGAALVADDEPAVRELARLALEHAGFTVTTVGDGDALLAAARELAPALGLVLLDVTMPGPGSEATLERLREAGVQAPVIVMSGHAESEVRERFAHLPVAAFLAKPFTGVDVRARVEQVLRERAPTALTHDPDAPP